MSRLSHAKKYDKESKIQSIFQSMEHLIELKDFNLINIREIAKEAGVSIGTIYLYFPEGKEGIVHEMINRNVAKIAPTTLIKSGEFHTVREFVLEILGNYYDFHVENKAFLTALERATINRPDLYQDINANIDFQLRICRSITLI